MAKAREQGKPIGDRLKGSPNRQTEKKHRLMAQRVDALIATGIDLEAIVVVEDGIDVVDWSHPDLEYARRWRPRIATVPRAHGKWGRLLGRRDTRRDQNIHLLVRAGKKPEGARIAMSDQNSPYVYIQLLCVNRPFFPHHFAWQAQPH